MVAIVGQAARMAQGGRFQQEVDLSSLFKDVAGEYVHMAMVPNRFARWLTVPSESPKRSAP